MDCKKTWNSEFIDLHFSYAWRNGELRDYQGERMFQIEMALFPETQIIIESRQKEDEARKEMNKQIIIITKQLKARQIDRETFYQRYDEIFETFEVLVLHNNNMASSKKHQFIRACPATDCRGFLNETMICGLCNTSVCEKCFEIKDNDHSCKKENIATAELIKKDSKPCPNCASMTIKISGCNNVFCRNCKTNFNWATLQIETEAHNPDFYQYLRENGLTQARNAENAENACGLPDAALYMRDLINSDLSEKRIDRLEEFHRMTSHVEAVVLRRYRNRQYDNNTYLNQRISYMNNRMNKKEFIATIQKLEKKRIKDKAKHEILSTYVQIASEQMRDFMNKKFVKKDCNISVINKLIRCTNSALDNLAERFKCSVKSMYLTEI